MDTFENLIKKFWLVFAAIGLIIGICFMLSHVVAPGSISFGEIVGALGVIFSFILANRRFNQAKKENAKPKEPVFESVESFQARIQEVKDSVANNDLSPEAGKQLIEDMIVLRHRHGPAGARDLQQWYTNLKKVKQESKIERKYPPDNLNYSPPPSQPNTSHSEEDWPSADNEPPSTVEDVVVPPQDTQPLKNESQEEEEGEEKDKESLDLYGPRPNDLKKNQSPLTPGVDEELEDIE